MIKTSYADQPCERCGSKKGIIIIQKVASTISTGANIEYSQLVCTNKGCQQEFDRKLLEKTQKNAEIQLKRAEEKAARKAQA